jgi:hypothetical protein
MDFKQIYNKIATMTARRIIKAGAIVDAEAIGVRTGAASWTWTAQRENRGKKARSGQKSKRT